MLTCLVLASCAFPVALQKSVTAEQLVSQGRALLPSYDGDHRAFLTELQWREVSAASHLLCAALALEPDNAYAMWWKGHAQTLLGEDRSNRGATAESAVHYGAALKTFDEVLAIDPEYHWAWYARGMAWNRLGRPFRALDDYRRCVGAANLRLAAAERAGQADQDARFVRYKARLWQADTRLTVLEFDRAREGFRAFYGDNGGDPWDLHIALGESYLRQREFAQAEVLYGELLQVRDYASFDRIHAALGYLAGLRGAQEEAMGYLQAAIQREREPTLYSRLWLWILAPPQQRSKVAEELRGFVEHPPSSLSAWDQTVGRAVLGAGSPADLVRDGLLEEERRKQQALPLDDLMCEVWFYAGLSYEGSGEEAKAIRAYSEALGFRPAKFKWEWAYARLGFARLSAQREEAEGLAEFDPAGELLTVSVHRAGATASLTELPNPLQVGDFVQAVVRVEGVGRRVLQRVIGVAQH